MSNVTTVCRAALLSCLVLLTSCASSVEPVDAVSVLDEYRATNAALASAKATRVPDRPTHVTVTRSGGEVLVTADYRNANAASVVDDLFTATDLDYSLRGPFLGDPVTLRVKDMPIERVLSLVLDGQGLSAEFEGPFALITPIDGFEAGDVITRSHQLNSITAEEASNVLATYFGESEEGRAVNIALLRTSNSIVATGKPSEVASAMDVLSRLDATPDHILIEALVIEFNAERITDYGSQLSNGASGSVSDAFFDIASFLGSNLSFNYDAGLSVNDLSFTLALDFLEQENLARVLSRPFVSTLSGKSATLEITEDRFVEVLIFDEAELNEISSGVIVEVLPIVTSEGDILVDFSVSESRFSSTEEDEALRRTRNSVESSALVQSGRTIIIGGLNLKTRATTRAGFPGANKFPPLSAIFGHKAERSQDTEVMIFLTPRRWIPGMDVPVKIEQQIREHVRAENPDTEPE